MVENKHELKKWFDKAAKGDSEARERLASYLLDKAFYLAERRFAKMSPMDDHEDIAISAVKSVCRRIQNGEHSFRGEMELSGLLRSFIFGKINDRRKFHFAKRRDISRTIGENQNINGSSEPTLTPLQAQAIVDSPDIWIDDFSQTLNPDDKGILAEMLSHLELDIQQLFSGLFARLNEVPRKVLVLLSTRNLTQPEIAEELGVALSSVERAIRSIKRKIEELTE